MRNQRENLPLRVAIIGAGFSGTLVATQLLKKSQRPLAITLVERRSDLAKGIAYSTQTLCHLLNVPAGNMSAFPDDPNHLVQWIEGNREEWETVAGTPLTRESFVPRKLYGLYLQDVLSEAVAEAAPGVTFEHVHDEVVALEGKPSDYRLILNDGRTSFADIVVMAIGNFVPSNPRVETPHFYQSVSYFQNPWSARALAGLAEDKPILLLGTGLTMVDLALALKEQGHRGTIFAISRHGYLPEAHCKVSAFPALFPSEPPKAPTAREIFHLVRQHITDAQAKGSDWRAVIDGLRPNNQEIWKRFDIAEKRRFIRHVKASWDIHRHRIAPQVRKQIDEMRESHLLQIHAGRLVEFHEVRDGVDVVFEKRGGHSREVLRVQRVINGTGPSYHSLRLAHPLLAQMHDAGWVRPHPVMGLDATLNGALIGSNGEPSRSLFALGSVLSGLLWETIAVPELRGQAKALAEHILEQSEARTAKNSPNTKVPAIPSSAL